MNMSEPEELKKTAPLMFLITRNPGNMSDQELVEHENHLRTLTTSSQTKRATITKEPAKKKDWSYLLKPTEQTK